MSMEKILEDLEKLKLSANETVGDIAFDRQLIESYAKAVFDTTFYHENYLTENLFKDESSEKDMKTIINLLNAVSTSCQAGVSNKSEVPNIPHWSVINVLGIDYAECISWRQGALLYAFCNIKLNSDPVWINNHQTDFLNYLNDGIKYLHTMLSLRKLMEAYELPPESKSKNEDIAETVIKLYSVDGQKPVFEDDDVYKFTESGVYSDSHLLAMMYCGEMCYWYCKYADEWDLIDSEEGFKMIRELKELGNKYLKIYIESVEQFFKNVGWNCERAKEIIVFL
ncbi:UPF0600 protein C5orf51-like protein [Dinothrombium tinctorium]|uniref:UPF0600 protein C5orf51-like protein n=1 Tax=Dinothrombium tinctorium TaxID=1965070 RepID=A0A3S3SIH0_9ACAR|nr:UPF0600 protein C5orf51-like protein [Dinothrombium tinctorium]